jgi:ATP-dependent Clp protease ATP-binding subunit ClpA
VKRVLDEAVLEARSLGRDTVEAQHLLLAIARDGESAAARIVAGAGADEESLRAAVARATA